jgi:hypothetical protein
VVGVGHCYVGLGHAHVQWILQGCRGSGPQKSLCTPSAILSFASLDICTCLVEYDENWYMVNTMQNNDICIYKKVNIHLFISLGII